MPHNRLRGVAQGCPGGNTALHEIKVAMLGNRVVTALDAIAELPTEEEIRRLRRSALYLAFVILRRLHVEERPDSPGIRDHEADAARSNVGRLEGREPALEPFRLGHAVSVAERKHRRPGLPGSAITRAVGVDRR